MARFLALLYGLLAYVVFFGTFLYAMGFVTGLLVPKTIDTGPIVPIGEALLINLLLLSLFAIQHSVMARTPFKRWWTQFVPRAVERSTYVLFASLVLILLFWQWRPIPTIIWQIPSPEAAWAVHVVSLAGWLTVLISTFLINHLELFGLQQVVSNLVGKKMPEPGFKAPALYQVVRHPVYFGFAVAFWAAPVMTVGHLLFAVVMTAYILVGIYFEERDLVDRFGDEYQRYRQHVAMLIPFWRKA